MKNERTGSDPTSRHRIILLGDKVDHVVAGAWAFKEPERDCTELCETVRAAVQTALTDKQREVVEAYFFDGLSQGEIARRLGVSQQVVQKRLYGARRGQRVVGGALQRLRNALSAVLEP